MNKDKDLNYLTCTFDGTVWAKEFWAMWGNRLNELDEETMHVWFANAIMAGYDTRHRETPEYKEMMERVLS